MFPYLKPCSWSVVRNFHSDSPWGSSSRKHPTKIEHSLPQRHEISQPLRALGPPQPFRSLPATTMASVTLPDVSAMFLPHLQTKVACLLEQKYPLDTALLRTVLNEATLPSQSSSYFAESPDSCCDFLNLCKMIFSQAFCKSLVENKRVRYPG